MQILKQVQVENDPFGWMGYVHNTDVQKRKKNGRGGGGEGGGGGGGGGGEMGTWRW